jgi:hypothetical protein
VKRRTRYALAVYHKLTTLAEARRFTVTGSIPSRAFKIAWFALAFVKPIVDALSDRSRRLDALFDNSVHLF